MRLVNSRIRDDFNGILPRPPTVKSQAQEVAGTRRQALGFLKAKKSSARIYEAKKFFQEAFKRVAESYVFVGLFSFFNPSKKTPGGANDPGVPKQSRSPRSRISGVYRGGRKGGRFFN